MNMRSEYLFLLYFVGGVIGLIAAQRPDLLELWKNYSSGPLLDKWEEYTETYQRTLQNYKYGQPITMIEIGVQSGGSMITWNKWFADSPGFVYVGIDINPLTKQVDKDPNDNMHVELGSQTDPLFLQSICDKYGPFDLIVDDGGHRTEHMITSLRALYPCLKDDGFYIIEDTCVVAFPGQAYPRLFEGKTFPQFIAELYTSMHYHWAENADVQEELYNSTFSNSIKRIEMLDSMVVIEKRANELKRLKRITKGTERIPYTTTGTVQVNRNFEDGTKEALTVSAYVGEHSDSIDRPGIYKRGMEFCVENTNYGPEITDDARGEDLKKCALAVMRGIISAAFSWDSDESLYAYSPPEESEESEESSRDGHKNNVEL